MQKPENGGSELSRTLTGLGADSVPDRADGAWYRYWHGFLTSGGRTTEECPDYLRITLLNLAGAASVVVWTLSLFLVFLGPLEATLERVILDLAGLLVSIGIIVSLRLGAPVVVVAQAAHGFLFLALLSLAIIRVDNPLMLALPLVYPAMAFLLLDDIRRGIAGTLLMTAVLNIAISAGLGPATRDSATLFGGALTVTTGMGFQAVVVALYVHHRKRVMSRLRAVSEQLAILASRDPLTGLYNRRSFIRDLQRELSRRERDERQLALLLFDVDRFKAYNDRFGHPQGDRLLKRLADVAREVFCRGEDVAFRLGGEEFAVIFRTEDSTQAADMADRLLTIIEDLGEPAPAGPNASLTVSAGLCLVDGESQSTASQVYNRADEALYHAKKLGRARWICVSC
ncbi:GGDEF domain-containing protein [Billgrantia endophytica]|uniref:diguanylate cyclase n=1 Tax=Billgrantia endophytica TaxID=2033802 RepID=A0A2N7U7M8_9GAMM|nr:GGDEF domain-containing protein [Halomonas endophytica]PMR76441.1 hypothetical protein C1H69_05175 [Halomonas endophytica]